MRVYIGWLGRSCACTLALRLSGHVYMEALRLAGHVCRRTWAPKLTGYVYMGELRLPGHVYKDTMVGWPHLGWLGTGACIHGH